MQACIVFGGDDCVRTCADAETGTIKAMTERTETTKPTRLPERLFISTSPLI